MNCSWRSPIPNGNLLAITERSSQVCFVCRRSHVQVSDHKPIALTEASYGFPQPLLQVSGYQATTASSKNPSHLQSALLSVVKQTMILSTTFSLSTRYVPFQFSTAVTVTLPSGMCCREQAALHCSLHVTPDCTAS